MSCSPAGVASVLFMGGSAKKRGQQIPSPQTGLQPQNQLAACQSMPQTVIIVPCRLESTRFPRKLLHIIRGRPLLIWVAERIAEQAPEYPLYLAVDHDI